MRRSAKLSVLLIATILYILINKEVNFYLTTVLVISILMLLAFIIGKLLD